MKKQIYRVYALDEQLNFVAGCGCSTRDRNFAEQFARHLNENGWAAYIMTEEE